jgi:hypothetical protein
MAATKIVDVGDGFWNIRGSFKLARVFDIGTHMSLVRRKGGGYVLLDACDPTPEARAFIDGQTDGGAALEAIILLHPFHTVFTRKLHERYPKAKLYGTARHQSRFSELPWEKERSDEAALHALFADDLSFSVPRGVELIPADENLHFSSVLAFHAASKTLHVDDTLNYLRLPGVLRPIKRDVLMFHPALAKVLERRAGAAEDFRAWTRELVERLGSVENLCAAHSAAWLAREDGASIASRVDEAVRGLEKKLDAHEQKHG